jgi:type I restriction enzyme S subunit
LYEKAEGETVIHGMNLLGLKANRDIINPAYARYFFYSPYFREQLGRITKKSVNQASFTVADLKKINILTPSLDQQAEIVDSLDRVKNLISKRSDELNMLDELIKARFAEMFEGVDKYPKEPLSDNVYEMFIGPFGSALKNECFVEKEDGFCIVYEQKHAIQKTLDLPTRYVSEDKYLELKRFSIYPGDIIVSCRGTIGELFMIPEEAPLGIMHPSIMKIRLNTEKYNQQFFMLALEQYMEEHNNEAKGSGVKMAVTAKTLGKELFVVPPMDVQRDFSAFVDQVDKSKCAVQKSLEETQLLFDSLMQEYFGYDSC